MSRLPVLSAKQVIKVLDKFGFKIHRQTGSHIHLWNEDKRLLVTVPEHKELAKGTLISIMKQAKLEREEFLAKLN
ncbi:MAG: type II toxin-antitoxin system HicA family toxin [Candidatus Methanoperedens sp.]|nr:type II toxin-antitoxin system HicA family toxin [Candidatus Methanoperedens sp.]